MPTRKTFVPSDSVKQRISKWEGAAMTGSSIDPLSKKWVKQNNSFENEAALFSRALPESIRNHVLSNQDLADNLFSYSYNVGSGKFKRRVVPALVKYFNREGTSQDIADAMVAQGDNKLRGLKNRREQEKSGVLSAIPSRFNYGISFPLNTAPEQPDALRVTTPYPTQVNNTFITPTIVPDDYVTAHQVTMEEDRANRAIQRIEAAKKYDALMQSIGMFNSTTPQFTAPYSVSPYAEGGRINTTSKWDTLSMAQKAKMIKVAVGNGITDLNEIKQKYNEFAEGGDVNPYTVGATVDALYTSNPREEFLGEPSHHYDFTQSSEWADAHGYYPDARGHRDDRVKKPAHPSHPSRGIWNGNKFELTDFGMQNPNYTLFGLNDGGQDPQAVLTYQGGVVLPETTVTPKENYIFNSYDNIILHQKSEGGKIHIKPENRGKFTALKERTGHSATWFKEHGTPAQKKMATFALNSRHWKHGDGGNLFDGTSQDSQQMQIAPTDATTVGFLPYIAPIKPELSTDAAIKRAKHVYTNYNQAKDAPFGEIETPIRNFARSFYEKGLSPWGAGMSNCTLTVSQWVDPTNPLNRAESIYNNPNKYNYTQILPDEAVPGNVVVARNPSNGTMHTMMIEGFADKDGVYDFEGKRYQYKKGEPLMVYSRGSHNDSAIRRGIPLSVYTAESEGKTDQKFFRYNYPNEVFLPELIIKPKKRK